MSTDAEGPDVLVDVAEALRANRVNWDDRAALHAGSRMYDLDGFVADPSRLMEREGSVWVLPEPLRHHVPLTYSITAVRDA